MTFKLENNKTKADGLLDKWGVDSGHHRYVRGGSVMAEDESGRINRFLSALGRPFPNDVSLLPPRCAVDHTVPKPSWLRDYVPALCSEQRSLILRTVLSRFVRRCSGAVTTGRSDSREVHSV